MHYLLCLYEQLPSVDEVDREVMLMIAAANKVIDCDHVTSE